MGESHLFAPDKSFFTPVGQLGKRVVKMGGPEKALGAGGISVVSGPSVSPAYIGVGYIIGPELTELNFSSSLIPWRVLVPLLMFCLMPQRKNFFPVMSL